jgi:lipoate-protein ligase A
MEQWRLLDTGLLNGAENITYDRVILDAKSQKLTPNTFRFLRFKPPVVLVGYHQSIDQEVRTDFCKNNGIDINRRITGGGAIYFSPEHLGWEVIADFDQRFPQNIDRLYEKLCKAAVKGINYLGLNARYRPKNDIEINHRKISGTGGMSQGRSFLFQGTLLTDIDLNKMLRSLRVPVKKLSDKEIDSLEDRITTLKRELGYIPPIDEIKSSILKGFNEEFNISFQNSELIKFEKDEFEKNLSYFKSYDWVYGIRENNSANGNIYTIRKTRGGLIRLALAIDPQLNLITSSFITGDFFAYPPEIIYDLEAKFKHTNLDKSKISNLLNSFFKNNEFQIPGIKLDDFLIIFEEAVDKFKYTKFGFDLDQINNIFLVNRALDYFKKNGCDTLLLPYCSKLLDCKFRYSQGCSMCGLCSIGNGYELAEKYGLNAITITSYEHLEKELQKLDEIKSKGYIGCCCEAFYSKHQMDFERFKTPGILINMESTTCYDLGLEKEAYDGKFEHQTHINKNLLEKILIFLYEN